MARPLPEVPHPVAQLQAEPQEGPLPAELRAEHPEAKPYRKEPAEAAGPLLGKEPLESVQPASVVLRC